MTTAVFAGTFDPITNGHLDIIRRGHALFGELLIGVGTRSAKNTLLPREERVALIREAVAQWDGVTVEPFDGLLVAFAKVHGADVLLRGVRTATDFDYEYTMAHTNTRLSPGIETVILTPPPELGIVSSTLVREIVAAGGDASPFVPENVARALAARKR